MGYQFCSSIIDPPKFAVVFTIIGLSDNFLWLAATPTVTVIPNTMRAACAQAMRRAARWWLHVESKPKQDRAQPLASCTKTTFATALSMKLIGLAFQYFPGVRKRQSECNSPTWLPRRVRRGMADVGLDPVWVVRTLT